MSKYTVIVLVLSFWIIFINSEITKRSLHCKEKEMFVECSHCGPKTCKDLGIPVPCGGATVLCKPSCVCIDGHVWNDNGTCIPKKDCPYCGDDHNATSGCGNHCGNTCSDYQDVNKTCYSGCRYNSCNCRQGYVYSEHTKKCILSEDCCLTMQPKGFRDVKTSTALMLLLHLSLHTVDEGHAMNPSCECVRFSAASMTSGRGSGTFSSPDFPRPYPAHRPCLLYTFLAAPHQIVEIIFNDFDVFKGHLECISGDYVKVYSEGGPHGPGPPGGNEYSGSPGVNEYSGGSGVNQYSGGSGVNEYSGGSGVNEYSGGSGVNEYSSWSSILCGGRTDAPPAIYSHGPLLVLEFHSGAVQTNATGFIGTYRFIDRKNFETDGVKVADTLCDYTFSSQTNRASHGKLYSPRYPSSYPTNVRCHYHFHARPHERIKLVFEESFLQKGDESCLSRADIIKVFDGTTSAAPVLAMLCNEVVGYEILSTGPDILVQFTANSNSPGQGFKANYQFQMDDHSSADAENNKKSETISGLGPAVSAATSTCDQVLRSDKSKRGRLTSPLYPSAYPPKTECHYDFLARGRERVQLVFEDFSLQRTMGNIVDCESMDSLDIFLNVDGRLEKMTSFCGNDLPKPIMSNGPKLSMEFRGIYSSSYSRGFKMSYSFVQDYGISTGTQIKEFPCAFVYNSTERAQGVVTSPNYPGLYPRDTECNYFFYGRERERVHLHFTHFDVEGVLPCEAVSASDYVQFSSRTVSSGSKRHCGQLRELSQASEDNFLRVTFRSNDRLDGTGFSAEYIFLKDTDMHSVIDTVGNGSSVSRFWALTFVIDILLMVFRIDWLLLPVPD